MANLKIFWKSDLDMTLTFTDDLDLCTTERSYHKVYTCEIWMLFHLPFQVIPKVSYFVKNGTLIFYLNLDRWPWPLYHRTVLSQEIHMSNMKAPLLTIQKLWPTLQLFVKKMTLIFDLERWHRPWYHRWSYHKEYTSKIWKLYHLPFKSYGQC